MKPLISSYMVIIVALSLINIPGSAVAQSHRLNVSTALSIDDPLYQGLRRFAEGVDKRTNGDVHVQIFPESALGSDEELLKQAQAGLNVAVVVEGGRLANYVPEFGILAAPYLVEDFDQLRKLVTSDLFRRWANKLADTSGHEVLSFNWYQGDRNLLTNQPVASPADLKGLRIRTPGAPVWQATVRGMGGTPIALPWSDVHDALQSRAIDAAEAQMPAVYGARLHQVIQHITKTGHISLITGLVASHRWFSELPPAYQETLRDEALAGGDVGSRATIESIANYERLIQEAGVTVTEVDRAAFRQGTARVYETLGLSGLRQQVQQELKR